jgi:hypothetical protein
MNHRSEINNNRVIIGDRPQLIPLLCLPLLFFLISEGYFNFGSGDKDIFILVP